MSILDRERNLHCGVSFALLILVTFATPVWAQTASPSKPPATDSASTSANTAQESKPSTESPKTSDTAQLSPKEARQAQIAADTDRLYQLAQELKAEVAKSNKDTLSLSVIKKAAEVEKLAHSLKDRMKNE